MIFPHTAGIIEGFTQGKETFNHYQEHQVKDIDANRVYDFTVYSIVRYFRLLSNGNPNIVDSLYTDQDCILHITNIGQLVRENRKLFLSKRMWQSYKNYAFSQMKKMSSKNRTGKRAVQIEQDGMDRKFAYHLLRLLDEIEQVLLFQDLDLRRNKEQLKAVRRGDISEKDIIELAKNKEKHLENIYFQSKLIEEPDEIKIQELLINVLESHYGSLDKAVGNPNKHKVALEQILEIAQKGLL